MIDLPVEIKHHIAGYLDSTSFVCLASTSKKMRDELVLFDHMSDAAIQKLPSRLGIISIDTTKNRDQIISDLCLAVDKVSTIWESIYEETQIFETQNPIVRVSRLSKEISSQWIHETIRSKILSLPDIDCDFFYILHKSLSRSQLELLNPNQQFSLAFIWQFSVIPRLSKPDPSVEMLKQLLRVQA